MAYPKENKLTPELRAELKQGTKIRFQWWGNSELVYTGRIEIDKFNRLYYVPEHCYENEHLFKAMQFYNSLDSFGHFTMFEILEQ